MYRGTWIHQTKQAWKVNVFLGLILLTLVSFCGLLWKTNTPDDHLLFGLGDIETAFIFLGIGSIAFAWVWCSICCPKCHQSVGKWGMQNCSFSTWFTDLLALEQCPYCGNVESKHL